MTIKIMLLVDQYCSAAQCATEYNCFNQPSRIAEGDVEILLEYDAEGQRSKAVFKRNGQEERTRYYMGDYEREVHANGTVTHYHYVSGPMGLAAMVVTRGGADSIFYVHPDRLGSITHITNSAKQVVRALHFDPWGNMKADTNWIVFDSVSIADTSRHFRLERGFTGHEHYSELKIINMNGRLYDPVIARFFSPDNFVQAPESTQGYNRYSYCLNNPLQWVDPSGERFGDDWFKDPYGNLQWFDTHESHITVDGVEYENVGERIWAWTDDYKWYVFGDENGNWHYQKSLDVVDIRPIISHAQQSSSQEFDWSPVQRFSTATSIGLTVLSIGLEHSNASFRIFNSKNKFDFRWYSNGWRGNQYVRTIPGNQIAKPIRWTGNKFGEFNILISLHNLSNSTTVDEGVLYTFDLSFDLLSRYGGIYGTAASLYYYNVVKRYPEIKESVVNQCIDRADMMKQGYIPIGFPGFPFQ